MTIINYGDKVKFFICSRKRTERSEIGVAYAWEKGYRIKQLNINGDLIKIWNSNIEASKNLKISAPGISKVCKGKRKIHGGFKWSYYNN